MKKLSRLYALGALLVAATIGLTAVAYAQAVTRLPVYIDNTNPPTAAVDFGNGPLEIKVVQGNATFGTAQNSTTSTTTSATSTVLVNPISGTLPCVGCVISGTGIPTASTVTVSSITGTTTLVLSASITVATGVTLTFGTACPATPPTPVVQMQAGVGGDMPWYTQARVCGWAPLGPGATVMPFAIGAH